MGCGAALPQTPATGQEIKAGRDQILDAYEPFLEASFGRGKRLLLSEKRLEWHPGVAAPVKLELSRLTSAALERRPAFEALLVGALCCAGAVAVPWPWAQAGLCALALLAAVACFAQRRFALVLRSADRTARIVLGVGTRRAPISRAAQSAWDTFAEELSQLGVAVER